MAIPLYSTFTLFTEIVMSVIIVTVVLTGYRKNRFLRGWAFGALAYEILFNISYMVYRVAVHDAQAAKDSAFEIGLAIFHGTLSLVMFVALVAFFILAARAYRNKVNYFKKHAVLTWLFLAFWFLAVVSGIVFYFVEYLA